MDVQLTSKEREQFQKALLNAFDRDELKRITFRAVRYDYDHIVTSKPYTNEVSDLVKWAATTHRIDALLREARKEAPDDEFFISFEFKLRIRWPKMHKQLPHVYAPDPLKGHKGELINLLSMLPISDTFVRRTSLLNGIPGGEMIERDEHNKWSDLELILTSLARRGHPITGEPPVVRLIANALLSAEGYEAEVRLKAIQLELTVR